MGVALGISSDRLEGMGEGQRLAEAVSREAGGNWSWNELIQSLEGAGQSELAKRITINKSELYTNYYFVLLLIIFNIKFSDR